MLTIVLRLTGAAALVAASTACGGGDDGRNSGSVTTLTVGNSGTGDDGDGDGGGIKLDIATESDLPGDDEECAAVSEMAMLTKKPADIIFVVDNSGSMGFEAGQIQAEMNNFSAQLIASGVDARVILISSYPSNENGICIDPPLGAGGCPNADSNPPAFTHVNQKVESHDAWQQTLNTYPQWQGIARPDGQLHLVAVTDDTSNLEDTAFDASFLALDPMTHADYKHHSVVCHSDCPSAAGIGTEYIERSNATMGVASDLCLQDFQSVFDVLTTEVVSGSGLSCEFEIPPPPDGMDFNPSEVNVEFDDGLNTQTIGYVASPAECANVVDGWYYDNVAMPTTILLCPQTCMKVQDVEDGQIDIVFGCATVPSG